MLDVVNCGTRRKQRPLGGIPWARAPALLLHCMLRCLKVGGSLPYYAKASKSNADVAAKQGQARLQLNPAGGAGPTKRWTWEEQELDLDRIHLCYNFLDLLGAGPGKKRSWT